MSSIVLASGSPRRREILTTLKIDHRVVVSEVDESQSEAESATHYVERLARQKARSVAQREGNAVFVLGADTTVELDGRVLGKPTSDEEAAEMIRRLSGRSHHVHTGIALVWEASCESEVVHTRVEFGAIEDAEIAAYVASGEGRDKAGGYAIQGLGAGLVRAIEGSYSNVVGLPAHETIALLQRCGAIRQWP